VDNHDDARPNVTDHADHVRLGPLGSASIEEGLALAVRTFLPFMSELGIRAELADVNPDISLALRCGGRVIGVFLISDRPAPNAAFNEKHLKGRYGLCGDALAVEPKFRGEGYGRLLRAALPALAARTYAEYVWCMELKTLNNLDCWLSRHFLLTSTDTVHVTVEPVTEDLRKALRSRAPHAHWAQEPSPTKEIITGRLVFEERGKTSPLLTDRGDTIVPWVVSDQRAFALPALTAGDPALSGMEGVIVEASGIVCGEQMAGVLSVAARETPAPQI
jgi:GNAT superfamily N-acetyltransferase